MSNLEGWAKEKIGNAVAPGFKLHSLSQLAVLASEMDLMIRWMLKTAIIFELASPRGDLAAVNRELFPVAAGKSAPSDFHIWAAYIEDSNFLIHLTRGFTTWNGGRLAKYQIHSASVDFALQLNHLALRLIRCPEASAGLKLAHVITDGSIVIRSVPFILPIPPKCEFPHTYLLRDFYAFLDLLEVHVSPPKAKTAS